MNHPYFNRDTTGFYIFGSSKELLSKVTSIMQHRGYLGIVDTAGRVHYLIDGRRNPYRAADQVIRISDKLEDVSAYYHTRLHDSTLERYILTILKKEKIKKGLKGHEILRYILKLLYHEPGRLKPASKLLYPEVARHFKIDPRHVDRVIRYATTKAGIKMTNLELFQDLLKKLQEHIYEEGRRALDRSIERDLIKLADQQDDGSIDA